MPTLSIEGHAPKEKLSDRDLLYRVLGEYLPELGMRIIKGAVPYISTFHTEECVVNYSGLVLGEASYCYLAIHEFNDKGTIWINMSYDPNTKHEDAVAYFEGHLGIHHATSEIHDDKSA